MLPPIQRPKIPPNVAEMERICIIFCVADSTEGTFTAQVIRRKCITLRQSLSIYMVKLENLQIESGRNQYDFSARSSCFEYVTILVCSELG